MIYLEWIALIFLCALPLGGLYLLVALIRWIIETWPGGPGGNGSGKTPEWEISLYFRPFKARKRSDDKHGMNLQKIS